MKYQAILTIFEFQRKLIIYLKYINMDYKLDNSYNVNDMKAFSYCTFTSQKRRKYWTLKKTKTCHYKQTIHPLISYAK